MLLAMPRQRNVIVRDGRGSGLALANRRAQANASLRLMQPASEGSSQPDMTVQTSSIGQVAMPNLHEDQSFPNSPAFDSTTQEWQASWLPVDDDVTFLDLSPDIEQPTLHRGVLADTTRSEWMPIPDDPMIPHRSNSLVCTGVPSESAKEPVSSPSAAVPNPQLLSAEPRSTAVSRSGLVDAEITYAEISGQGFHQEILDRARLHDATIALFGGLYIQNGRSMLDVLLNNGQRETILTRIEPTWQHSFVDLDTAKRLNMMDLPYPPTWMDKQVYIDGWGQLTPESFAIFKAVGHDDRIVSLNCLVCEGLHPCGFIAGRYALWKLGWALEVGNPSGGPTNISGLTSVGNERGSPAGGT